MDTVIKQGDTMQSRLKSEECGGELALDRLDDVRLRAKTAPLSAMKPLRATKHAPSRAKEPRC